MSSPNRISIIYLQISLKYTPFFYNLSLNLYKEILKKYFLILLASFLISCGGGEKENTTPAETEPNNTTPLPNETATTEQEEPQPEEPFSPVFTITVEESFYRKLIYFQHDNQNPVQIPLRPSCIKIKESQFVKLKIFKFTAVGTGGGGYLEEEVVCNYKVNDCPTQFSGQSTQFNNTSVSCDKTPVDPCPVGHFRLEKKEWKGWSEDRKSYGHQTKLELRPAAENTNKKCIEFNR